MICVHTHTRAHACSPHTRCVGSARYKSCKGMGVVGLGRGGEESQYGSGDDSILMPACVPMCVCVCVRVQMRAAAAHFPARRVNEPVMNYALSCRDHGSLPLPAHASLHLQQLPQSQDVRGGPVLQHQQLPPRHRLVRRFLMRSTASVCV